MDDVLHLVDGERGQTGTKQWAQDSETLNNTDSEPNRQAAVDEVSAEAGPLDVNYQSKDGSLIWSPSPIQTAGTLPVECAIKKTPGPTKFSCSRAEDIKSTFDLFFSESMRKTLITLTNLEAQRVLGKGWKKLDWKDIQGYIGLLILAGVYRSRHEPLASLWQGETGRPIFCATMRKGRFMTLSRIICLSDMDKRRKKRDKLAEIRDFWEKWVKGLRLVFNPGPDVTVGDYLVRFRGRCPFRNFMPQKLGRYGIKLWAACDARTSYVWNMQVYTGKPDDGQPVNNQAKRVVLDMTSGLQGHTITCNRFFTSYALGQELLKKNLTMIGPVRKNNTELPLAFLSYNKRAQYSSEFAFTDTHTVLSYFSERKNVLFMSTHHKDATVSIRDDHMPKIISDYNRTKDSVSNLDKVLGKYSCKKTSSRWSMVLFYHMLDVSAYNAFVLWTEINPSWNRGMSNRRRHFLEELGNALVFPLMERRQYIPRTPASLCLLKEAQHLKGDDAPTAPTQSKRKRCRACGKKNRKTSMMCQKCKMPICKEHAVITVYCLVCANP
ncbi:piggyBac transposable element-derived protein 4-like isoform X1 [Triplophysa rosa]|nr:piggyBac transposable element-derived protein 4-like isoform X1 [Triplophysa rosa]